jgi:RNA polymerase sigma-70 factor (ECF subfamily)
MQTDEELVRAYREQWGSTREDAIEELFRRHQARIVRWCCRFTRDRESALDLAQEILLRAFRNLHNYRGECRFSTWLYVIARNLCVTAMQRRAVEPVWAAKAITADLPDPAAADIHRQVEMEQSRRKNWNIILETLDQTEAKVMLLHYGQELSLNAVSRILGLTNKSGAKAYIVSAKRKLHAATAGRAGASRKMAEPPASGAGRAQPSPVSEPRAARPGRAPLCRELPERADSRERRRPAREMSACAVAS